MLRRTCGIGMIALLAAGLAGCATEPEPAWTEEEAYAAAEETFRGFASAAYESEVSTLGFVTGEMTGLELEAEEKAAEADLQIRGEVKVVHFEPLEFDMVSDSIAVQATACIDSSDVEIQLDGADWAQPRAEAVYGVEVSFASVGEDLLIDEFADSEDVAC